MPRSPRTASFLGSKCKCSICHLRSGSKRLACIPQKMRSRDRARWCHVVCAQFVTEVVIEDGEAINVQGINPRRHEAKCAYCGRGEGAKVACSILGCSTRFHAGCALVIGSCALLDVSAPNAMRRNRVVYCPVHLPSVIRCGTDADLKRRLKESQDLTMNCNQNNLMSAPSDEWNEAQAVSHAIAGYKSAEESRDGDVDTSDMDAGGDMYNKGQQLRLRIKSELQNNNDRKRPRQSSPLDQRPKKRLKPSSEQ